MFAADPRVRKARVFFIDQASVVLYAGSDGRIVEDLQPMTECYVTCVAEQDGQREENFGVVAGLLAAWWSTGSSQNSKPK